MRECIAHVLNYLAIVNGIRVEHLYFITDGAPGQFKNRFMSGALVDLVTSFRLKSAEHCFPPTATFKGVHDAEGHVDVYHANDAERRGTERFVTTRNLLEFLWGKNNQPNPEPNLQKRKMHTLDERVRILVMDEKDLPSLADRNDERILILDLDNQLYNINDQTGIMSRGSMRAISTDGGVIMQVRNQFCSCFPCMHITPENSTCVHPDQVGNWKTLAIKKTKLESIKINDKPLVNLCNFLSSGGSLPVHASEPKIVVGYVSPNNRDVRYAILIRLPRKLDSPKSQERRNIKFLFEKGEYVVELLPLTFVKEEDGFIHFNLTNTKSKPKMFIHRLSDIVIPSFPMDIGKDRFNMLNMITTIPPGDNNSPHLYKIPLEVNEILQQIVNSLDADNKSKEK